MKITEWRDHVEFFKKKEWDTVKISVIDLQKLVTVAESANALKNSYSSIVEDFDVLVKSIENLERE